MTWIGAGKLTNKEQTLAIALSKACEHVACDRCPLQRECYDSGADGELCDELPEYFISKAQEE